MKNTNRTNTGLAKRIISLVCALAALLMVGASLVSCGAPEPLIGYDTGIGREKPASEEEAFMEMLANYMDIEEDEEYAELTNNTENEQTAEEVEVRDYIECRLEGDTLIISGHGRMDDFIQSATYCPWEDYIDDAKKIVIEEGITNIGARAFYCANSVEEVIIADTVTEIGYIAFANCDSLRSVTIPDSVTKVGEKAFWGCAYLSEVNLSAGMTEISKSMFGQCYSLETIVIPSNIKTIRSFAFDWCGLKNVTISDGVEKIEGAAFNNCMYLEFVKIPSSVTEMEPGVFSSCYDLKEIVVDNVEGAFTFGRIGNKSCTITFTK